MKRSSHEEREANMTFEEAIAKSIDLRARGHLSDFDLGILHQKRAEELGISLAKYYDSPEGAKASKAANASHYFNMQYEGHLGNGHPTVNEIDARKRVDRAGTGRQFLPTQNGDGMDIDWSDDVAATKAYRAEKEAKARESDQGPHQNENRSRRERRVSGANLNHGPIAP
jgi:hypothetical protein